jgi:hypothetical protein
VLRVASGPDSAGETVVQYIPQELLQELGLYQMKHTEFALLVRDEYLTAFNTFQSWSSTGGTGGGVVVAGQPGIGAWQPNNGFKRTDTNV